MRTVSRLRLLCFASSTELPQSYGFYIAGLSISILLTQSILCQAHHKKIATITMKINIANNDGNLT
jgi:hypothetical protein